MKSNYDGLNGPIRDPRLHERGKDLGVGILHVSLLERIDGPIEAHQCLDDALGRYHEARANGVEIDPLDDVKAHLGRSLLSASPEDRVRLAEALRQDFGLAGGVRLQVFGGDEPVAHIVLAYDDAWRIKQEYDRWNEFPLSDLSDISPYALGADDSNEGIEVVF